MTQVETCEAVAGVVERGVGLREPGDVDFEKPPMARWATLRMVTRQFPETGLERLRDQGVLGRDGWRGGSGWEDDIEGTLGDALPSCVGDGDGDGG
jgi:hypothetical protein